MPCLLWASRCNLFMLEGPAGAGKTSVIKAVIAHWKSKGDTSIIVMASTGVAAQLLPEGVTVHSFFEFKSEAGAAYR